jgi:hypothetical protein
MPPRDKIKQLISEVRAQCPNPADGLALSLVIWQVLQRYFARPIDKRLVFDYKRMQALALALHGEASLPVTYHDKNLEYAMYLYTYIKCAIQDGKDG